MGRGLERDGAIQVPVQGLERPDPAFARVLRHELAHSFVTWRTGNNCPTWLQEGIAQWLEGGDPRAQRRGARTPARASLLPALVTLEGPFHALPEAEAQVAYAASLSAVAHILRRRGEAGVVRLLSALGDRLPSEEALPGGPGPQLPGVPGELARPLEDRGHGDSPGRSDRASLNRSA